MQSCSTGRCIMKIIVEASAYLVILSFICLISLDFIAVNKSVSKGSEVQQYIKDVIQINGISYEHRDIDYDTNKKVCEIAAQYGADVSYEYFDAAADYDYYRLNIKYPVKSRLFGLNKLCDYKALVRVEMALICWISYASFFFSQVPGSVIVPPKRVINSLTCSTVAFLTSSSTFALTTNANSYLFILRRTSFWSLGPFY